MDEKNILERVTRLEQAIVSGRQVNEVIFREIISLNVNVLSVSSAVLMRDEDMVQKHLEQALDRTKTLQKLLTIANPDFHPRPTADSVEGDSDE